MERLTKLPLPLCRLQRQMFAQYFCERLAMVSLVMASLLLVGMSVCFDLFMRPAMAAAFFLATFAIALVWAWARRATTEQAAARIDRLAGTRDRFVTALAFSDSSQLSSFHAEALKECTAFIDHFDTQPWAGLRFPGLAKWLGVPLIAIGLLAWHHRLARPELTIDPAAEEELAQKSGGLKDLAQQLEQAKVSSPELDQIAEQLRQAAARMKEAPRSEPEQAHAAALRELSALEVMIKARQEASPADLMQALAEALKNVTAADRAREALQSADAGKAAEALDQLARDAEKHSLSQSQIEQALRDAEAHLRQQENRKSQQLAQVNQMSASGSAALQRLAQMLRDMGGSRPGSAPGSKGGSPADPEMMKRLLQALQNLKYGQQSGQIASSKTAKPGQTGGVAIVDFGNQKDKSGSSMLPIPSGQPGSEHDEGTTDTPLGERQNSDAATPQATQIKGAMGEGESLQELVATSGDDGKAQRRYRELYEAAAPLSEETVLNENIPLGSRFFIKRYFESIRPRD